MLLAYADDWNQYCKYRFEELKSNPAKARKAHNKPKSSSEFATKYLRGFYTIVGEDEDNEGEAKADSKSHK